MKTASKDTRYIIKRILIGVGIALILANLRKCNVYAEDLSSNVQLSQGSPTFPTSNLQESSFLYSLNSPFNGNIFYNYYSPFTLENKSYIIFYDELNDIYFYNFFSQPTFYDIDISDIKMIWNENQYIYLYKCKHPNTSSCSSIPDYPDYMQISGISSQFILSTNSSLDLSSIVDYNSNYNYTTTQSPISNEYFYTYYGSITYKQNSFSNYSVYSSDNITNFSIDDESINVFPGFSKITLSENESVYFLPKNYNDIQIETIQTGGSSEFPLYTNYIDFNYYFTGDIKDGYFPISNLEDFTIKNIHFSPPPLVSYVDSYFPMYQDGNSQSGYQYYAYIIYNNFESETSIYYNSTLFNSFIIHDIDSYNESSCYIDRNNNNVCANFDFQNLINNAWLKGFATDDGFVGGQQNQQNNLSLIFDKLKIPFNWLKSLTTYTCSSISLPIPFTNSFINIECLSSRFHQVFGDYFYNIIFIIINGLYAYRITLLNIDSITDGLDPTDDKLEVVEL